MNSLRNIKDLWALLYLVLASALPFVQWQLDEPHAALIFLSMAFAYGVGCILHNHAHLPMWRVSWLNAVTDYWLIILRGDGVYSWIPTHVNNHHRYANHEGDLTLTWRYGEKNTFPEFVVYTANSAILYAREIYRFLAKNFRDKPRRFFYILSQIAAHASVVGYAFWLNPEKCFWYILVPQAWGVMTMVSTGYFQHHLADEDSPVNFSRNFVGRLTNFLHFNHGYHSVHHINPRSHWTEWPAQHAELAKKMDPRLNEANLFWYIFRSFVLAPVMPRFSAVNLRNQVIQDPTAHTMTGK